VALAQGLGVPVDALVRDHGGPVAPCALRLGADDELIVQAGTRHLVIDPLSTLDWHDGPPSPGCRPVDETTLSQIPSHPSRRQDDE
jgi:hypothetical protein